MTNILAPLSEVDNIVLSLFEKYRINIFDIHKIQWNEEDLSGFSKEGEKAAIYYAAIYLGVLIYSEARLGYNTDWNYYLTKYKINKKRKQLACCGIDLDEILSAFGLPLTSIDTCISGINSMEIEECFVIEPTTLPVTVKTVVNFSHLISTPQECFIYIN